MLLKIAPYIAVVLAIAALLYWVDYRGYNSGLAAGNLACVTTTKDAVADNQKKCDANNQFAKGDSHEKAAADAGIDADYNSLLQLGCASGPAAGKPAGAHGRNDGQAHANTPHIKLSIPAAADIGRANDKQAINLISCQNTVGFIYRTNGHADLLPPEWQTANPPAP